MRLYYDRRAPEYDDWWLGAGLYADRDRQGWDEERRELELLLSDLPPMRTLDVACGTGFLTRHLPGDIVALDQSERMLAEARRQARNARLVRGDALALPFDDGAFERVFASFFYCHLQDEDERTRFLAEARRVGGEVVLVGARRRPGLDRCTWEERVLKDGSRWTVFKRYFLGAELAAELGGGDILHEGRFLVVVRA